MDAVVDAVQSRLRPIAMATLTTICGLSPPVLLPGEGTEIHRGVGVIVVFGLMGSPRLPLPSAGPDRARAVVGGEVDSKERVAVAN